MLIMIGHWRTVVGYGKIRESYFSRKLHQETKVNVFIFRYSHKDNLHMGDFASELAVIESLKAFKKAGGGCIVENSTFGLNRRTSFLKELSLETGVQIIAGTGIISLSM